MKNIERFYDTTFTIKRPVWSEDESGINSSEETAAGNFVGYRQQASPELVVSRDLHITSPHIIWCPVDTDVQEGDVLESDYGTDIVEGVQINRDGRNAHKELTVSFNGEERDGS